MALIHSQSGECLKTDLDVFTVPYTQTSIEQRTFIEIPPVWHPNCKLIVPIHSDFFFQDKLLLNGVDLGLKFVRSKDKFSFMANQNAQYHTKIVFVSLFIQKVSVSPTVRLAHSKALQHANAKYPIDSVG